MIFNYFKIAWRNMMKSKAFSFINIFGLAVGLTCCMLITIYLRYELTYDSYQKDVRNMYQITTRFTMSGKSFTMAGVPAPMAKTLVKDFPEVEGATRLVQLALFEDKTLLQYRAAGAPPLSFYEDKGFMTDSNFFQF